MEAMKIFTPEQIRNIEQLAIVEYHISEEILMENAAHAIFRSIKKRFKDYKVIILCGPGNNGGDGMAVARLLDSEGWDVRLSYLYNPAYKNAALKNFYRVSNLKTVEINSINYSRRTLVIDALFGTGLNRTLDRKTETIIRDINISDASVLSIDIPSGIDSLTGKIIGGNAINADVTVTFIGMKMGQLNFPASKYCGELLISPISIPSKIFNSFNTPVINFPILLKQKERDSHKSSNGIVVTVAGSSTYFGAPYFSSKTALLAGSGYSILITSEKIAAVCAVLAPEVIYISGKELEKTINKSICTVFGPGIGISDKSFELLKKIINLSPKNLIIDADGLTLLSQDMSLLTKLEKTFIITPHPGEMARLLKRNIVDIEENRIKYANELSVKIGAIVVLKGQFTVIASPDGEIYINNTSSVTLATAGSGDILCGIISGLIGFNDLITSVRAGVYIHGLAGIITEEQIGTTGVTASDIMAAVPQAVKKYNMIKRESFK